ncbi:UDP-N-acetylmuramoyl-L-alanyl-D-glutamate--2,6-diaminopimelate ligase [Bacillus canaveralius]|uniref:UDP-N-acetylmuramoyl-L-alanyl-D-glutamate--2, 6-diaminopimelate ligase n=1 Tax=Bacillus canaveralius TaxID=1403243 RepID=UPI000F7838AC|nr:UDP-N-acetylmuramoyl-L-alanyl-D-glutamate--2,6-diaminopimelate ligase [Bacillus canaveralius]RSK54445.1 UDP-N-acetylmuramoyl-L-alanyl-D-glutamate--2,6-diaminopimelate ligase [Bacillus canaveralius]
MRLSQLLQHLYGRAHLSDMNFCDAEVFGIEMDSRQVRPGDIFIAISGYASDGHSFIDDAVNRGAVAVIGEKELQTAVPYFQVIDSRKALGKLSSFFYGMPAQKHKIIGITGTNGKTTVAYMLRHILETAGQTCSMLGTVSYIINNEKYKPTNTTPDSLQLQRLLSLSNDEFVVLEISSHALSQHRVEGLEIDYGVFTNLGHDHLDYHHSMNDYFLSKCSMFSHLKESGKAVINRLNEWGDKLAGLLKTDDIPVITLGNSHNDYLRIENIRLNGRTRFTLDYQGRKYEVSLQYPGLHNVHNAAIAFLAASDIGIDPETSFAALESFKGVPGRFEVIEHPEGAKFIIDYAHTDDAIEYCLQAARQQGATKITHIYGFRGARDRTKRESMIAASVKLSDRFIMTFDDLNGEEEHKMEQELIHLNMLYGNGKGEVLPDRTLAIQKAWSTAKKGEWVFITGKGPEEYERPFTLPVKSDKDACEYLLDGFKEKAGIC